MRIAPTVVHTAGVPRVRAGAGTVRWVSFCGAAAVAAAAVGWGEWWRPGPVLLAALSVLELWSGQMDRRAAARRAVILLFVAAGLCCVRRPPGWTHAGLRIGMLVAGTFLLAAVADTLPRSVAAAVRRLSARLSRYPSGWTAHAVAFLGVSVPMAAYCLSIPKDGPPGDTLPPVATAARMLAAGDRDLSAYLPPCPLPGWKDLSGDPPYNLRRGIDGRLYSAYPAGMEAFAVPAVSIAVAAGDDPTDGEWHTRVHTRTAAVVAGLTLGLFFLSGLRLAPPEAAAAATAMVGVGSALATICGQWLWQQTGIAFWTALVLFIELRADGKPGWKGTLAQGIACGMMFACRPSAATFLVPFGLWVLARDRRRGLLVPLVAGLAYLPWAVLYWVQFGQPLGPSAGFLASGYQSAALAGSAPEWAVAAHLDGVLFSPGRGLLVYQPWVLLAVLLALPAVRGGPVPRGWYGFAAGFTVTHLLLVASWGMWWGGWCFGSRLAAELIPVLGLLTVRPCAWLLRTRWGWLLVLVVASAGLGIHATAAYPATRAWNAQPQSVDFAPARLWDWADAPFLRP